MTCQPRAKKERFRFSLPTEVLLFGYLLIMAVSGGFLPAGAA